jgi:hypothetical protein
MIKDNPQTIALSANMQLLNWNKKNVYQKTFVHSELEMSDFYTICVSQSY